MKTLYRVIFLFFFAINGIAQQPNLVDGYTDKLSYRALDTATFYTKSVSYSSTPSSFTIFYIDGTSTGVTINGFNTDDQPNLPDYINTNPWKDGYGYAPTCTTWTVPDSNTLPSGYYMLDNKIPIIIKDANYPSTADIVIVCPTNTINAYTSSGGKSLYPYNSTDTIPSKVVSFHRPQSRGQYSYCDDGFLLWLTSTFAPAHNYTYNFISDTDLEDTNEIANAKLLILPGHSEYWTRQARLNFDQFVDAGKNALILSGNTMWMQVRYETNNGNPQLICHRGVNWDKPAYEFDEDSIANINYPNYHPLQATYNWSEPDLKYSTIGSIGSDTWRGGYGAAAFYSGGHKILVGNADSPILDATNLSIGDTIPMTTAGNEEVDGTFVKANEDGNAILVNGDPELDISALGFFRAEMLGYHLTTPSGYVPVDPNPNNSHLSYCPFMVFKKTKTSGTIINVNSNRWCTDNNSEWTSSPSTHLRPIITENMITLMMDDQNQNLNGDNLFQYNSTPPNSISLVPNYSNVSYSACEDGSINITPDGIYLNNAYKIDNGFISNPVHVDQGVNQPVVIDVGNNSMTASIDNNCATYQALRIKNQVISQNDKNNYQIIDDLAFSLFPNPATGKFTLQMLSENNSEKNILIFNSIDQEIYHKEKTAEQSTVIDLSACIKGIYFVKVVVENKVVTKKIAII